VRVLKIVHQKLKKALRNIHSKRFEAVWTGVDALLFGGKLTLTALGRASRRRICERYNIKQMDRLLGNVKLHGQVGSFFSALTNIVVGKQSEILVLVDWSEFNEHYWILSAAVPFEGRSLTIYEEVHRTKKLYNEKVEREFLQTLHRRIVPAGVHVVVITDAGYRNPWFKSVQALGWDYIGRLGGSVLLLEGSSPAWMQRERENWRRADEFYKQATPRPQSLGAYLLAKGNPLQVNLVLFKAPFKGRHDPVKRSVKGVHESSAVYQKYRKRALEPWMLVTSLEGPAKEVVRCYSTRMRIEENFRDKKSHRFGWGLDQARVYKPRRLEVLLLLSALAMLVQLLVGWIGEELGLARFYQVNSVRGRRVLSLLFLGRRILQRPYAFYVTAEQVRRALHDLSDALPRYTAQHSFPRLSNSVRTG
jgi:Transposase DDE domain